MNTGQGIDYKGTAFEYPDVIKIHRYPTLGPIIEQEGQIKANAMSVHTLSGGGRHGHLGMACKPATCAEIPDTKPYKRLENPGVLQIAGGTAFEIAQQKVEHEEATRLFQEVLGVEQALIKQIIGVIKGKFLEALWSPMTGKMDKTIPQFF